MYSYTVQKVLEYIGVDVNPETLLKKWLIYWEPFSKDFHNETNNKRLACIHQLLLHLFNSIDQSRSYLEFLEKDCALLNLVYTYRVWC